MRFSRGLSVIGWYMVVLGLSVIGTLFGSKLSSPDSILLLAFVIAWCRDE
jgi:hypothetical protein